jgi:phosphoribosylglycinamide formyltransferase-1
MKKFAIFASGRGSNLVAIHEAVEAGKIQASLALVFSDRREALALKYAQDQNLKNACLERDQFPDKKSFEDAIIKVLKESGIDFIVLAGYMRILSPHFIQTYRNKILNVHPSLLPAFKGAHAIRDAFAAGVKETGVTVHLVDEEIDHGAVIAQKSVPILPGDTLESLEAKIHSVEHKLYPDVIKLFARGALKLDERR